MNLTDKTRRNPLSLLHLSWPIMIELLLQFALGTVDTLMVSRISDDAVAVVGISNQYLSSMNILFTLIGSGAGVLISQKLGAGLEGDARRIAAMSIKLAAIVGGAAGLATFFGTDGITRLIQVPEELNSLARTYLGIVGLGLVLNALNFTMSAAIRSTGNTRSTMYISFGMNAVHVVMNYGFIFGALGFPKWGLAGVAVSTVASRAIALLFQLLVLRGSFSTKLAWSGFRGWNAALLKQMARIGWPMAVGQASWSMSQLIMFSIVASLGAEQLAARTYMGTLEQLAIVTGWSIAMALQIQIAHLYGAGRREDAYRSAYRAFYVGISLVAGCVVFLAVCANPIASLFTSNPDIASVIRLLILMNLMFQPVKMVNMAFNTALVAIGDTRYIMVTNLIFIWIVCVGGSFLLGIGLGWGIVGVYLAMTIDEGIRGFLVFRRWRRTRNGDRRERLFSKNRRGNPEADGNYFTN